MATPYDERAAVMRRAANLTEQHSDEIVDWLVRETELVRLGVAHESMYASLGTFSTAC